MKKLPARFTGARRILIASGTVLSFLLCELHEGGGKGACETANSFRKELEEK